MSAHVTTRALRRRLALWSLLPVLALTAACAGEDEPADSSSGSESSESASGSSDQPYDAETVIPAMESALGDETSARIQMELTGQAELTIEGRMAMTEEAEDGEMELTVAVQGQSLEMRQVDGLIYVSGPPATPPGKWLEVDPSDPNDPVAQQFAGLAKSGDLTTTFDAFREGLQKVEHVGEDEIDGETTDHYVFTVDAAKAAEAQGQQMPPGSPQELSYDVWLTEDDLMRRVSFELGAVQAVIDATEWGEPVDVEAPAAGDIVQRPGA
jgi:hypothetical protein